MGDETAHIQIEHATIANIREDAKRFLANSHIHALSTTPSLDDVRDCLRDGWYVVPLVNARVLNDEDGYSGHFIFVYGFDDQHIVFHNPGLPARAAQKVRWDVFDKARSWPDENNRSMWCFRAAA